MVLSHDCRKKELSKIGLYLYKHPNFFYPGVVIGLVYYHVNGKCIHRLHTFFPGSVIDKLKGHLPCTYGLEVKDLPATGTNDWRMA